LSVVRADDCRRPQHALLTPTGRAAMVCLRPALAERRRWLDAD